MVAEDAAAVANIGFGRRFFPGDDVVAVAADAYGRYANVGRASPYPGLPSAKNMLRMQRDLERWTLELMEAPSDAGALLTSGGTESVIMAVRACLRAAGRLADGPGEIVAARSAHPCIDKAADIFGLKLIRTPVGADHRADVAAIVEAITPRTVMLYSSFPSYAYGLEDDIPSLGALALEHGLWLHVDACMSGFLAPFLRMNGASIPEFGLTVPGVSSISADLHKHAYSAKGASVLVAKRDAIDNAKFSYADHPLPAMTTPTLAGTAPGAPLASAWAVMRHLGRPGYRDLAHKLSKARRDFVAAIRSVEGFDVLGEPLFSLVVVTSDRYDMTKMHAGMAARGWFTLMVSEPQGLHLNIGPLDGALALGYAADLQSTALEISK